MIIKKISMLSKEPLIIFFLFGYLLFHFLNKPKSESFDTRLLHQAIKLKLYENDSTIKKMLIQKMKLVLRSNLKIKEPSEETLFQYYKKHIDDYSIKKSLSFYQIFFKKNESSQADDMLDMLQITSKTPKEVKKILKPSKEKYFISNITYKELKKLYGNYFTHKVFNLKTGVWHKTIPSPYGLQLIYISEVKPLKVETFDSVQGRVYQDYKQEIILHTMQKAFKRLPE